MSNKNTDIKPGDLVLFTPNPRRGIGYFEGKREVIRVVESGIIILKCGNIQLYAGPNECIKLKKQ